MPGTIVDMHTHTTLGAYDSALKPEELAESAKKIGLTGVSITEHDRLWDRHTLIRFREEHPSLLVSNGMEVSTDLGHVLAFGLPSYVPGIQRIAKLREVAIETGAFLIAAHPFRHWFSPVYFSRQGEEAPDMDPGALARLPLFDLVDGLEVLNGCNTPRENLIAWQVAQRLGKPGTAGSDCHSRHGIGYHCTVFERELGVPEAMLTELHAGRFVVAAGLVDGRPNIFTGAESLAE